MQKIKLFPKNYSGDLSFYGMAAVLAIALFSLAGIPLTAGFVVLMSGVREFHGFGYYR